MGKIFIQDDNVLGMTPAHTYSTMTDFDAILDDIGRDLIPTGTGQPFPVVWASDFEENELGLKMAGNEVSPFRMREPGVFNDNPYVGQFGGIGNDNKKW